MKAAGAAAVGARELTRSMGAAAFDPLEKSILELQRAMAGGQITSAALVQFYLDRIAAYDHIVNAMLYVSPNALEAARTLDAERRGGTTRGPLHGIPILLKDNFDTKDMPTTGGCLALAGHRPRDDAFQVRKLREAGAVLLGKVNLHELALGLTTVSSLGGQTLDPYDLTRAPGGSSGGSAVAATANFAAATLGTDTAGSIRIPSSHNNVCGLRPSEGLSSRAGIIPFSRTQDTGGPIARTVEDLAVILDATAGADPADPVTMKGAGHIPRTYTSSLRRDALKGARIGVLIEYFGTAPEDDDVGAVVRHAIDEMKALGATAVEVAIPALATMVADSTLFLQEIKASLGGYLKTSGAPVASVDDLLASGLHVAQLQGVLEIASRTPDDFLASAGYARRLAARDTLARAVLTAMNDHRVDALAYPIVKRIAPVVIPPGGGNQLGSNEALSPQTGFPAINVPAGFTRGGFPVGMELLGRPFAEPTLLALAYAFEHSTRHRRPPAFEDRLPPAPAAPGRDAITIDVAATGAGSIPPSNVPFTAAARFRFDSRSRSLGFEIELPAASLDAIGGVYLHRQTTRQNGGVAHILAKRPAPRVTGVVELSAEEADSLTAGKLYLSVVSRQTPRLSARADLKVRS